MPTFKYSKLVRDNIPVWHDNRGHAVSMKKLSGEKLKQALCKKLHEESDEVADAQTKDELIAEIADVQQILSDLCAIEDISDEQVEAVRIEKLGRKGGFMSGYYIESVTMPKEDDRWVIYCREYPNKYPEILPNK